MAKSFVVIGLGKFGIAVAKALSEEKLEVIAIDRDEKMVNEIADLVTEAVVLDATDEKALRSIEVQSVDVAIVAVGDIEESILITLLLKELGIKKIVAKAVGEEHKKVLEKIGATKIILPEQEVGQNLARALSSPRIFDHIEMSDKYSLVEIKPLSKWVNKTIRKADIRNKYNISIVGIKKKFPNIDEKGELKEQENILIAPSAETKILKEDILIIIGDKQSLEKLKNG
ncbi:MAG: TrkA family potassium uptake protein [Spirochaetes bacterium]|nr:TrkA family potassium uptake protein [Spirochaetota bacterium]